MNLIWKKKLYPRVFCEVLFEISFRQLLEHFLYLSMYQRPKKLLKGLFLKNIINKKGFEKFTFLLRDLKKDLGNI